MHLSRLPVLAQQWLDVYVFYVMLDERYGVLRQAGFVCGLLCFVENADGYPVAPHLRNLQRFHLVRNVMARLLELEDPCLVPFRGVYLVVGRAWLEYVYHGAAFVHYGFCYHLLEARYVQCIAPGDERRPHRYRERKRIHRLLQSALRSGVRLEAFFACGRRLSFCQTINFIVLDDMGHV